MERRYMCVGEKFKHNSPIGDAGKIKSIKEWLVYLNVEDVPTDEKKCIQYILERYGKRLERL